MKQPTLLYTFCTIVLLLGLGSCSQSEIEETGQFPEGRYPVEIGSVTLDREAFDMFSNTGGSATGIPAIFGGSAAGVSGGSPTTRISETGDGSGSLWDGGEQIIVQPENGKVSARYTVQPDYSATAVDTPIYWLTPERQSVKAWYPAVMDGTVDLGDQHNKLCYVLSGSGTGDYRTPVTLVFTHALAKLRITLAGSAASGVYSVGVRSFISCSCTQGAVEGVEEGWVEMMRCDYKIDGSAVTCWEANVVPGTEISRVLVNGQQEGSLATPVTPEAGKLHNIALEIEFPPLD